MAWEFACPVDDCTYETSANEEGTVLESAQQHMDDAHGDMPTREEIEPHVSGPG